MVWCAGKPTSPLDLSIAVTGPLQLTARWKPPAAWNTQPGNYQIIAIEDHSPLWVHILVRKVMPMQEQRFLVGVQQSPVVFAVAVLDPNELSFETPLTSMFHGKF